ncbi:MAG TPA: glycosyltransferase family 4 protein [Thermoplasmata archaeon]|nr:glycosyltransferase family 4 protein [Thermoplasmata archaeon]
MGTTRVAFVSSGESPFIERDRAILRSAFVVHNVSWRGKRSLVPLASAVARSDVTFSWFALDHAYAACRIARVLRRKSLVVVGGVDAANRSDLSYGVFLKPRMARRTRYAIAESDRVLIVDDNLRAEIIRNSGVRRGDIITVPLGFDTEVLRPDGGPKTTVLTVAFVTDSTVAVKGLLTFAEAARLLPDLPFVLVGAGENAATERLRQAAPPNLSIVGPLFGDRLLEQFRRARVYVQVSRSEAFGSALAEAMACGCIPIGTRVGGIPNVIGDTGFFVPIGDAAATAAAIRQAYGSEDGARARTRIIEEFPLERRRRALVEIVRRVAEK